MSVSKETFSKVRDRVKTHFGKDLDEYGEVTKELFGFDEATVKEIIVGYVASGLCNGKIMLRKDIPDGLGEH